MRPKPLGEWSLWQVGLVGLGWMVGVFAYMALRSPIALTPANLGPDDYYIEAHVQYVRFLAFAPTVLLVAVWLWRRRVTRARQLTVAAAHERGH